MRQFDLYEFSESVVPGMFLLVGAWCLSPEVRRAIPTDSISFGGFGLGVVLAYGGGQLLQTFGNIVEKCWWCFWGGMPSDWLRTGKHELIAPAQAAKVEAKVGDRIGDGSFKFQGLEKKRWYSITRQVSAAVAAAGQSERIDVFNARYGLCRGMAASLLILTGWSIVANPPEWRLHVAIAVPLVLAISRMHRFGVHYARELFVQFLEVPDRQGKGDAQ